MIVVFLGVEGCGKDDYVNYLLTKASFKTTINSKELPKLLENKDNVIFNQYINNPQIRKNVLNCCKDQDVLCCVFHTSFRPDICKNRINKWFMEGKLKYNTSVLIPKQAEEFKTVMRNMEKFKEELKSSCKRYKIKYFECEAV